MPPPFVTGQESYPIALTIWLSQPQRWCGFFAPDVIADGTVVGYDGPEGELWKAYFPVGMRCDQMRFLYWSMRDFKITYTAGSMSSHMEVTGECGNPPSDPNEVTQDLFWTTDLDGDTIFSTDDAYGRNSFFPGDSLPEGLTLEDVPLLRGPRDLVCHTKRELGEITKPDRASNTVDSFDCEGATTETYADSASFHFRLFDAYGTPAWMYSAETGLYYPRIRLEISTPQITFASGQPTLVGIDESVPYYKSIASTFTIKGRPGSGVFEEDIVIPAVIQATGYEEVTSVGAMTATMEITSTWDD